MSDQELFSLDVEMIMDLYNPLILIPILAVTLSIYYLINDKLRVFYLLVLSLAFLWFSSPDAFVFLLFLLFFNYLGARVLQITSQKALILSLSILLNITAFSFPRFINIFSPGSNSTWLSVFLPIGIAFIILQNITYLLDVYRGHVAAEKNLLHYLLTILFFPKLLSGPIEPVRKFLKQIKEEHTFQSDNLNTGISLIMRGLFKKIVIANRLALITNQIFDNPGEYHGLTIITGIIFYSFQIYYDFSSYTNIATGIANLFGYQLSENFARPFLAINMNEFWSRWHITFTNWLRETIFFPSRRILLRKRKTLGELPALLIPPLLTMLVSGIWHGFDPIFIVWGIYHGLLLVFTVLYDKHRDRNKKRSLLPGRLFTFSLVTFGWFFFRPSTLADAGIFLQNIFIKSTTYHDLLMVIDPFDMSLAFIFITLTFGLEIFMESKALDWRDIPTWLRWSAWLFMLLSITLLGIYKPSTAEFIYAGF